MNLRRRSPRGFTLTENLMALTVIVMVAIPLTGMLGLVSNSRTAADHRRESAIIARQIAAELAHSTAELAAPTAEWCPLIAFQPVTGAADDWPYLANLPAALNGHSVYLVYNAGLRPAGEIPASAYEGGVDPGPQPVDDDATPLFVVRVAFENGPASVGSAQTLRVTITVGSPALAPVNARRVETFTTLIHIPDRITGT